jgi:hypothetical protein
MASVLCSKLLHVFGAIGRHLEEGENLISQPHSSKPLTHSFPFVINVLAQHDFVFVSPIFLSSSMAEHSAVNRRVVGSSPTSGANKINNLAK